MALFSDRSLTKSLTNRSSAVTSTRRKNKPSEKGLMEDEHTQMITIR